MSRRWVPTSWCLFPKGSNYHSIEEFGLTKASIYNGGITYIYIYIYVVEYTAVYRHMCTHRYIYIYRGLLDFAIYFLNSKVSGLSGLHRSVVAGRICKKAAAPTAMALQRE